MPGRLCALRKTDEAIAIAQASIRRTAGKEGRQVRPETLPFARYVILFSTLPPKRVPESAVLEWYGLRWQVELVFKRFKSLAQLGHLPNYDDNSAKAWLYGKLLEALLVENLVHHAQSIFPLGLPRREPSAHPAGGVKSSSRKTRSHEQSNRDSDCKK